MNDERTAKFLKNLADAPAETKTANMNLRVDPDLKYLMDLHKAHIRKELVTVASKAMWQYLHKAIDRRLILDEAILAKLELEGAQDPSAAASVVEDDAPSIASLGARLRSRED